MKLIKYIRPIDIVFAVLCVFMLTLFFQEVMLKEVTNQEIEKRTLLRQELTQMEIQNDIVRSKIYEAQSLQTIASKASELGFKEATYIRLDEGR